MGDCMGRAKHRIVARGRIRTVLFEPGLPALSGLLKQTMGMGPALLSLVLLRRIVHARQHGSMPSIDNAAHDTSRAGSV